MITDPMRRYLLFIVSKLQEHINKAREAQNFEVDIAQVKRLSRGYHEIVKSDNYEEAEDIIVAWKNYEKGAGRMKDVYTLFIKKEAVSNAYKSDTTSLKHDARQGETKL